MYINKRAFEVALILFVADSNYVHTNIHIILVAGFIGISSVVSFKARLKPLYFYYCYIY